MTSGLQLLLAQMAAGSRSGNVWCCVIAVPDADEHGVRMLKTLKEKNEGVWMTVLFESTSKSYRNRILLFLKNFLIQMFNNIPGNLAFL